MSLKNERNSKEGIIQLVFKMRDSLYSKMKKNTLPLIFAIRINRKDSLQYFEYQDLKKQYPNILIEFFEKNCIIQLIPQCQKQYRQFPSPKKKKDYSPKRDERQNREREMQRQLLDKNREILELREYKEMKQLKELMELREWKQKQKQVKEDEILIPEKINQASQSRPIRSCRFRNDILKHGLEPQIKEKFGNMHKLNEQPFAFLDQSETARYELATNKLLQQFRQYKVLPTKKILDYDYLVDEGGCLNLISPAVIPSSKSKQVIEAPIINYQQLSRNSLKAVEKQHYSSQQFKESQSSEFILDERGKEKRRRQKLMKEQQRLNKRKKVKKIKKKKKPVNQTYRQ